MRICLTCGKKVDDASRWCSRCGHDLNEYTKEDAIHTAEYQKVVKFKKNMAAAYVLSVITFVVDVFVVAYILALIGCFVVGLFMSPVLMTPETMFIFLGSVAGPAIVIGFVVALIVQRILLPKITIPELKSPSALDRLRLRQVRRKYERISTFCNLPIALFVIALIAIVFIAVLMFIM